MDLSFGTMQRARLLPQTVILRPRQTSEISDLIANLDGVEQAFGTEFGYSLLFHDDGDRYRCSDPFDTAAGAQQADSLSHAHPELLERAYLFKNVPDGRTGEWFEALLPVHVPLRQRRQGAYDDVLDAEWKARRTLAAYFSMVVNLRLTRESSAPVRTPSYMPKLTYFDVRRREATTLPGRLPTSVRVWAVPFVPYGHYSNGQDGCLFTFQTRVERGDGEDAECADPPGRPTGREPRRDEVNRVDGSFSSHYTQLGVTASAERMPSFRF